MATIVGDGGAAAKSAVEAVELVNLDGSDLNKKVQEELIELDGKINYTVTYRNTDTMYDLGKVHFYDIFPYNDDENGSNITDATPDNEKSSIGIASVNAVTLSNNAVTLEGEDENGNLGAESVKFYYSVKDVETIKGKVTGFENVDNMLESTSENAVFSKLGEIETTENGKTAFSPEESLNGVYPDGITCIYAVVENWLRTRASDSARL